MSEKSISYADLLDSMMRVAFTPPTYEYTDSSGQRQVGYGPSVIQPFMNQVTRAMGDEEFAAKFMARVEMFMPEIAKRIAERLPDLLFEKVGQGYGKPDLWRIVTFMREPVEAALAEALKPAVAEYVASRFPTADLDSLGITVNIEVKLP